ncbi:MAG: tRNA (N6-threonylcarbamoyladenosine(37)-N6)-methyltransferase TrmO [Anaerolineales bacterium]
MKQQAMKQPAESYKIFPVGHVRREEGRTVLKILPAYAPALKELERFSHVQVFWWFSQFQNEMYREITQSEHAPYDAPVLGVFACRSPVRPNPIGLTTAKILRVDHEAGEVEINDIDAFDGTPILDLKAYFPSCDRVKDVRVAEWAAEWPEWLPEEGLGLEE